MNLADKILDKGNKEVEKILTEAKSAALETKNSLIEEANKDCNIRVSNIKYENNKEINNKKRILVIEERQAKLLAKQRVIDKIFSEVLEKLASLENEDLLKYIVNNIKNENLVGNEILYTNKKDYDKYLKALSTNKKGELVLLDKLNKILNTNFKMSERSVDIDAGFIFEGKDFDLNFSFSEVIEILRNKYEKIIVKELF